MNQYHTHRRFNEFHGVILYQGVFEHFQWESSVMGKYLVYSCNTDDLDKRKKEAQLLVANGGFLC
ncbi:MAG: hypothetical protein DYG83_05920 [Candidatus Brocadia sp. AMX2]|nr:hypothetical protein [Candidatus Brocadia sp.]MBL1169480.1 hypothetical protein [Candidatus Brocadia sp. AMX1]MCE7866356.1 hypothetical protein [Candidatus Brocadia sp. AMX2]MCQ3917113.1 hypothetical protein [Candidatus Brocadia sp.]RIJ91828.1 MAG: hypothetical protein DB853_06680 [Candidatus Brocadia sp.]